MSMVALPPNEDLLGIANGGQAKTFFESQLDFIRQSPGGAAEITVTIAGGVIAVSQFLNAVDTEAGAAADDLTNIDPTGIPNGTVIALSCLRADHVPTVKHGVAGAGRILLSDAADYALNNTSKALLLRLRGADWVELTRSLAGDLGTAAKKNTGTANGNVPLLGSQGLPAVSGELLTDIPRIGNFAPSQQPTPNMTLAVAAGSIMTGTALTKVAAQNTATITAPATNARNDIVYVDAATGTVGIAAGAENASPVDPAVPAGKIPIARIRLATTTTSIKSSIIDDIRPLPNGTAGGRLLNTVVFLSSGTYTKNPAANYVVVHCIGGGGGSGGAKGLASWTAWGAGGGAGGATIKRILNSALGSTEAVTVGAGGAAGSNAPGDGGTGGTSSFGSWCSASGGQGGMFNSGSATFGTATSAGGVGAGGDVNLIGAPGALAGVINGNNVYIAGGAGSPGKYGQGGPAPRIGIAGAATSGSSAANNTGAGATGGSSQYNTLSSTAAGGVGGSGIVIVEEYA